MQPGKNTVLLALLSIIVAASCTRRKDPEVTPEPSGKTGIKIEMMHKVNSANLALDTSGRSYVSQNGDSFSLSSFNYYISNIRLTGAAGTYTEAESYHLIESDKAGSKSIDLKNVPAGTYSSITFMIGVDSLRNVSGAQTGALDPSNGMFWDWNTGYIMWKVEGRSPSSPLSNRSIVFHGGGFSGSFSALRTVTLPLTQPITVAEGNENHIHVEADVAKFLSSPNTVSLSSIYANMTPNKTNKTLSDNFANMFKVTYAGL